MTEGYIASTIQVEIPQFADKYIDQRTATLFQINLVNTYSNQKWALEKEYDAFDQLERQLAKVIPNMPQMEGKSFFKVTSYDGLVKRRYYLENFLKECCVRKDILSNEYFKDFLELDKHSPELTYNTPMMLSEYDNFSLGIRDMIYLKDEGVVFAICSEMNIASRLDATLTNINLPWEKKTDMHISLGAFFAFKVLFDINKGFSFEKVFAKSYPEQTGVISYEKDSNSVHIGLDSGRIVFYKLNGDCQFNQYELYIDFKPHKARVMGLAYDPSNGHIYSCSTDKKFLITEFGNFENPTEIIEGPCGFTNLIFDRKNERIFLTNEMGMVSIYLLKNCFPPVLVNNIQTAAESAIRGLEINYNKSYIFTAAMNGIISVLDMNKSGKEKLIKEISSFGGQMKLRLVRYRSKAHELITGDEEGRITIWNLKTAQSISAWNAHVGPITQMYYYEDGGIIISCGKDKNIRAWKLPEKWINEDIKKFEENEIRAMSDTLAMIKLQKSLERPEDYNSDEDSLNGWDFRD